MRSGACNYVKNRNSLQKDYIMKKSENLFSNIHHMRVFEVMSCRIQVGKSNTEYSLCVY